MLHVDEFESAFRAADKPRFVLEAPQVDRVLLVTDLEDADHDDFLAAARKLLLVLGDAAWETLDDEGYEHVPGLLQATDRIRPDLVVTYRNLKDGSWRWPYSLGVYLDVLTRETDYAVLVLPNPREVPGMAWREGKTNHVMVVTDHLAGDAKLVNWGVRLTEEGGTLHLTHIENAGVFERYMATIGKVPAIDTDSAREEILDQLLDEPRDYIASTKAVLEKAGLPIGVEPLVTVGHPVDDQLRLAEEHEADILIFHAQDQGQLAMHGAAYSLAVKLRTTPLLLL